MAGGDTFQFARWQRPQELETEVAGFRREWRSLKLVTVAVLLVFFCGVAAFAQSGTSVIFAQLFTKQTSTGRSKVFVDARNGRAQSGDHEPRCAVVFGDRHRPCRR